MFPPPDATDQPHMLLHSVIVRLLVEAPINVAENLTLNLRTRKYLRCPDPLIFLKSFNLSEIHIERELNV